MHDVLVCFWWGPPEHISKRYLKQLGGDYEWDDSGTKFTLTEAQRLAQLFGATHLMRSAA